MSNQQLQQRLKEHGIQPKLTVSEPDDKYEKEAERVADAVMRVPDPTGTGDMQEESSPKQIQRLCSRYQRRYRQGKPLNCEECEEELQRKPEERGAASDRSVEQAAAVAGESGQPLSASTRSFFENRMGRDFSDVRVHTGSKADRAAHSINAKAFTLSNDVVFRSGAYRPGSRGGRRLIAHELTHVLQSGVGGQAPDQFGRSTEVLCRQEGQPAPQSFAATEESVPVKQSLVNKNEAIENRLFTVANHYRDNEDLRWFFTYTHAMITRQINDNIDLFQRPNALIRLNMDFALTFLEALEGEPHKFWKQAFRECQALEQASEKTAFLVGETEACGARMANVHISVDLKNSLQKVGCIPPEDYGNMLVLVKRGSLAALSELRGDVVGAAQAMGQHVVSPVLDLEIEEWRNAAYSGICGTEVPSVDPSFSEKVRLPSAGE